MTPPIASIVKAKLRAKGRFVLTLRGRCMEPLLFGGDRAAVFLSEHPQVGELALVLLDCDKLAIHRIVDSKPGLFITKGDYSGKAEKVTPSHILGVAKEFSLEGGPWVEDPREENAIRRIVALSLAIGDKDVIEESAKERNLIWDSNKSARSMMLERTNVVVAKLAYTKPVLHYWKAEELNAIEATMSGGGGGGSSGTGGGLVYTDSNFELPHGGAIIIVISSYYALTYYVRKTMSSGILPILLTSGNMSGTRAYRVELPYGTRIKVQLHHRASSSPNCNFGLSTDYATHSGLGARWEPNYTGTRPSQSPICLMRWYVTEGFSGTLLELLEDAFYNQVLSLLQSNLAEEAVGAMVEKFFAITVPEAWAITSALKSLLEIFGLVQMAQFNQVVRDNLGGDYLMVVYDHGDGATPHFSSNLETRPWSGGTVKGEPGYAGTFTDNSTFTATTVYHE